MPSRSNVGERSTFTTLEAFSRQTGLAGRPVATAGVGCAVLRGAPTIAFMRTGRGNLADHRYPWVNEYKTFGSHNGDGKSLEEFLDRVLRFRPLPVTTDS